MRRRFQHGSALRGEPGQARRDDTAPRRDVAAAMLALQGSAGNRAVGALLARTPDDAPGKPARAEGAARVTLEGIGTITVESVQLPAVRGGGAVGSGRRGTETPPGGRLVVTSRVGPHSPALVRASTEGRGMSGRVELHGSEIRLELTNAIVTSYQVSTVAHAEIESWTLDVEAVEHVTPQPDGGES